MLLNSRSLTSTITHVNSYYLTLVLKPGLEEKERKTLLDALSKKLTGEGGKVAKEDLWGVDKILKLEEDVLRYLLIRK
ncbi:MAG: hypothetical protein UT54_C0027G0010 [Candidatus Daviesbacteria bacterium GW2011_GWB1_39_5]|nr:MAG: hypothetical protein UT54_C0027G0010 [Candidatus Daviesbacteria bacterium GW2011_GWB1_39_5]